MGKIKSLGKAELEIMKVIWRADGAITSLAIKDALSSKPKWALSTLMTSLARLEKKGFVFCDRSTGTNLYHATILEEDYKKKESRELLESLYNDSVPSLVSNLYKGRDVTDSDITELRNLIKTLEAKKKEDA